MPKALPPLPLPAPLRRALRVVNPIRRYQEAWDLGNGLGKFIRATYPELLPFGPRLNTKLTMHGAEAYYDCPSIGKPYLTPTMMKWSSVASVPIGNFLRCTILQAPNWNIDEVFPEGHTSNPLFKGTIMVGPATFYDSVNQKWIRMSFDEVWSSDAPGLWWRLEHHARRPSYVPSPQPEPLIDPLTLPIFRPMPEPVPLPMRVVRRLPAHIPFTRSSGYSLPRPVQLPQPQPGPTIIIAPKPQPLPEPYEPGRPPRGTRERKILSDKRLTPPRAILEGLSEVRDAVGALYGALPQKYQTARSDKDLEGMLKALYNNSNQIDMRKAIANLLKNWAEDKVIGRLDAAINKAGIKLGPGGAAIKNPITSAPQVRF